MKNVLLAYGYSQKNAGDLAITVGAIDLLLNSNFNISVLSRYDEDSIEYKNSSVYLKRRYGQRIKILPCPFTLDRNSSTIKKIYNYFLGALYLLGIKSDKELNRAIYESSMVIFNGGNLLRCSSVADYSRLKALFYPIKLARKYNKEVIIFPQSTIKSGFLGSKIIHKCISDSKVIFVRESQSYRTLQEESTKLNLRLSLDAAFFIDQKSITNDSILKKEDVKSKKNVAITLRAHGIGDRYELPQKDINLITAKVIRLLLNFTGDKYRYYIVIQCDKDRKISELVRKSLLKEINNIHLDVCEEHDPVMLADFYANMDLLIGMRLHSIILALSRKTPCVGLFFNQWGLKNPGIMEQFSMPYEILDEKNVYEKIVGVNQILDLLENKEKYSKRIAEIIESERASIATYFR